MTGGWSPASLVGGHVDRPVVWMVSLVLGAGVFARLVVPSANPIRPIGSAVPYAYAGFAAAAGACVLSVLLVLLSGGWGAPVDCSSRTRAGPICCG